MVVNDLITILKGRCITSNSGLNKEIQYVFCCDCKRIVKEKGSQDYAWVNADADVASIDLALDKAMSCIIVPYDISIDVDVINYAILKGFPIISTNYSSYKVCSKIYEAFKERT